MENRSNQPSKKSRRRRVMRNRAILLIASAALVCALAAAGAVAFLIDDTEAVKNEFTPSYVTCEVEESFDKATGEKSNVRIQNTGDIPAYIRVALVTYCVDGNGNVDGTKTAAIPAFTMGAGWVKSGEYYYFTKPVAAGALTDTALIDSITLENGQVVEVIASAIQSEPANAVNEAWGVTVDGNGNLTVG